MGYEHSLTSKSQVTVPKDVREVLGVAPGGRVRFEIGDHGQVTLTGVNVTHDQRGRRDKIRMALCAVAGKYPNPDGMSTDAYMRWLRGDADA